MSELLFVIYFIGIIVCVVSNGAIKCCEDFKKPDSNIFSNIIATHGGIVSGIYGGLFWPMLLPIVVVTRVINSSKN